MDSYDKIKNGILEYLASRDIVFAQTIFDNSEQRKNRSMQDANLRELSKDEICVEFDLDTTARPYMKRIIKRLRANNYSFVVFDKGGRSPHIHIYNIKGLGELDQDVRKEYILAWFKKFAPWECSDVKINYKSSQLIAMEFREHFKHGIMKEIVLTNIVNDTLSNKLDLEVLNEAIEEAERKREIVYQHVEEDYTNQWFLNWIQREKAPQGERNNVLLKNLAILIHNRGLDAEPIKQRLSVMYDNRAGNSIENWMKWASSSPRRFGFSEVAKYFNNNDMSVFDIIQAYKR